MYVPVMLVLGQLSTHVVRDLLVCICFGRSLHYAALLLTSFDCLSFMNMCSGSLHGGDCVAPYNHTTTIRESSLSTPLRELRTSQSTESYSGSITEQRSTV